MSIDEHRQLYGVEPICKVLPIAPSTYHAQAARRADPARLPARARRDLALKADIRRVFEANLGVYGLRKVWRQLGREGKGVARCTVARLIRRMGLQGVVRDREVRTTVSNPAVVCPLDRVNRQFHAPQPNALWLVGLHLRRHLAGLRLRRPRDRRLCAPHCGLAREPHGACGLRAGCAEQAWAERRPVQGGGLVHHSDRGARYVSIRDTERSALPGHLVEWLLEVWFHAWRRPG
jgi:putative transposase